MPPHIGTANAELVGILSAGSTPGPRRRCDTVWPASTHIGGPITEGKGHATIGALAPSPWLFPRGQPGRPISSARLTQRLNSLDIHPSQDRSTALFQLAAEVPAAILACTLGIHTDVAVTWQRHSAGDWTAYAAEVSRRKPTPQARHSEGWDLTPPLRVRPERSADLATRMDALIAQGKPAEGIAPIEPL
jgi:hypothetical protein